MSDEFLGKVAQWSNTFNVSLRALREQNWLSSVSIPKPFLYTHALKYKTSQTKFVDYMKAKLTKF